jgi:hypothetical protein
MNPLEAYKEYVRSHPLLVQGVERLLQLFAWSPQRFSSSELAYESYSAAIGLLSLWHDRIINGDQSGAAAGWQTCLTAVELVGADATLAPRARGAPVARGAALPAFRTPPASRAGSSRPLPRPCRRCKRWSKSGAWSWSGAAS